MADTLRKQLLNLITIQYIYYFLYKYVVPDYVKPKNLSKQSIFKYDISQSPIKSYKDSELCTSDTSSPLKCIKLNSLFQKSETAIKENSDFVNLSMKLISTDYEEEIKSSKELNCNISSMYVSNKQISNNLFESSKKERSFTLASETDSPVKENCKYLQNPLSLRYIISSCQNRDIRIHQIIFDEYYCKEIEQKVSQYTKAENFLHNLGEALYSFRIPILRSKDNKSNEQDHTGINRRKKKLKRKVVKKKHLACSKIDKNLNELTQKLIEIEIELEFKPQNLQNKNIIKGFIPFSDHEFSDGLNLHDHTNRDRLIPMSKIKRIRKTSNNSHNLEDVSELVNDDKICSKGKSSILNDESYLNIKSKRSSYINSKIKSSEKSEKQQACIKDKRKRIMTFDGENNEIDLKHVKETMNANRKKSTNENEVNRFLQGIDKNYEFNKNSAQLTVSNESYCKSIISSPIVPKSKTNNSENSDFKDNHIIGDTSSNHSGKKRMHIKKEKKKQNTKRRNSSSIVVTSTNSMLTILSRLKEIEEKMDLAS